MTGTWTKSGAATIVLVLGLTARAGRLRPRVVSER